MARHTLVVLHKTDESFGYYDVAAATPIARVGTRPFPHEVCLSPDRSRLYVAEMGVRGIESAGPGGHTVAVYDTRTRAPLGTIDTTPYDRPHGIATHATDRLFVTSESTRHLLIYELAGRRLLHAVPLEQDCAHMVSVSPDGAMAYTANIGSNTITAVDTRRGAVARHIPVLQRPEGMVFSPDGALIYVVNRESAAVSVVDTRRGETVDTIETGHGPVRVAITPDGARLAVPLFHSDAVQIVDTRTRRVTATVDVGRRPAGTAMSPDGSLVFMSCEEESAVYVLSMRTAAIVGRIPTGPGCDAMVCLDNEKDLS